MPILIHRVISQLLAPYLQPIPDALVEKLSLYLDLLMKWNARTNLTAIRDPEEMVRRHFGESLFAGAHLPQATTLLDFGSGAGFPGLPIQLLRPDLSVTLAESQNKKASFLREAARTLDLRSEVWSARVESMPPARQFDIVILRAVDNMAAALTAAQVRAISTLAIFTTVPLEIEDFPGFDVREIHWLPGAESQSLTLLSRLES